MRHGAAALLSSVLATAAAVLTLPAAAAAADGFAVTLTEVPGSFTAGADARTVEAVASTDRGGCRKVRWSMVLRVDDTDIGGVRVSRVEEDDAFPLRVQADGDTARLTDARFDPGSLCRGRTVTARYRVAFDDDVPAGRVRFRAQAFDAANRLLEEATATSRVVGAGAPAPSASPSPAESPEPGDTTEPDETGEPVAAGDAAAPPGGELAARRAAGQGGAPSLLGPGLIIGAALVFAGVGLLLRIRLRNRGPERHAALH